MNSIRTPRQGVTASSRRIAEAVDNEEWQKFRLSLKGWSTATKLDKLAEYYDEKQEECLAMCECQDDTLCGHNERFEREWENVRIRIDNYIKALCRGGQLYAGESLETALNHNWELRIKK